ncbi:hypothetical protein ACIPZ5_01985 [Pseudomonas sp. NPDC089428]|uniref:hypothetical protein n=1 Tax=Pseudomonas sp. NPDC089428 TaxID=3364467 RepID=UPI00381068F8
MKYYKDLSTGGIWAYEDDVAEEIVRAGLIPISNDEYQKFLDDQSLEIRKGEEGIWVSEEMSVVADQLLMLEDGDPNAIPGASIADWRSYRVALRAWNDGADGFPSQGSRPVRPGVPA